MESALIGLAILAAFIILLVVLQRLEFLSVFTRRRRAGGGRPDAPEIGEPDRKP